MRRYIKPLLIQGLENQTKLIGETVKFNCEFSSDLHPYIFWMYFKEDDLKNAIIDETEKADENSNILIDNTKIITVRNLITTNFYTHWLK